MRGARVVWLGLLTLSLTGCIHGDLPARSSLLLDRLRGPSGPDAVFLEYSIIERPAGSTAINRDVWANIDELILDSDTRALLVENGFRTGVIGGQLPSELEAMISNPKSSEGHRQQRLYANNPVAVALGGPIPIAEYQVRPSLDAQSMTPRFERAKFSLAITPSLSPDGRITLHCMPEVEYQDKKHWLPTGAVGPAWLGSKPIERYETVAWNVTLSPREFLVIGTAHERGAWLGNLTFESARGNENVQRLLIVRAVRLTPADSGLESPSSSQGRNNAAPIAAQASIARGSRP